MQVTIWTQYLERDHRWAAWPARKRAFHVAVVVRKTRAEAADACEAEFLAELRAAVKRKLVPAPTGEVDFRVPCYRCMEDDDPGLLALLREREHGPYIPFEVAAKQLFGPKWRSILRKPKRRPAKRRRRSR
jgi:hypothetical protein